MSRQKNLHFCRLPELYKIKESSEIKYHYIKTYRTGFVPSIYPGDLIRLNYSDNSKKISFLSTGIVIAIYPIQYRDMGVSGKCEVKKYNRDFNLEHWFFKIVIRIWNISTGKEFN